MLDKKGQSALEYLMAYGWALVVIVIVIAALVVLINPSQVGGSNCTGFNKFLIKNFSADSDSIVLIISNMTGGDVTAMNAARSGTVGSTSLSGEVAFGTIASADQNTIDVAFGTTGNSGETYNIALSLSYTDQDGLTKNDSATCQGTIP